MQNWIDREPAPEHLHWFEKSLALHTLTHEWLDALDFDQDSISYRLKRVQAPLSPESVVILESLLDQRIPQDLASQLEDQYPEEYLVQLEDTATVVQAWLLQDLLSQTAPEEHATLIALLGQRSWDYGRKFANNRWPTLSHSQRADMDQIYYAWMDSPLTGKLSQRGAGHRQFLVRRRTDLDLELELIHCPHKNPVIQTDGVRDSLCKLHFEFHRGFVFALNPSLRLNMNSAKEGQPFCRVQLGRALQ